MKDASGKTALITGASSGIGYELAKCFAQDGHNVILVSRSQSDLRAVADELQAEHGIAATPIAADLSKMGAAQELYDEVKRLGVNVDFLVNDAGQGNYGKFWETDLDKDVADIHLNVYSTVVLTKLFLQDMVARGEGKILQLASMVSKTPAPYMAVYGGTKAFIYNFTLGLAEELEGTGVTVTALRPGATATDFFHKAHAEEMEVVRKGKLGPADQVARDGYEALMSGRTAIVSGLQNKAMNAVGKVLPDPLMAKAGRKMHQPGRESPGKTARH